VFSRRTFDEVLQPFVTNYGEAAQLNDDVVKLAGCGCARLVSLTIYCTSSLRGLAKTLNLGHTCTVALHQARVENAMRLLQTPRIPSSRSFSLNSSLYKLNRNVDFHVSQPISHSFRESIQPATPAYTSA
jgi:hypothetical protein